MQSPWRQGVRAAEDRTDQSQMYNKGIVNLRQEALNRHNEVVFTFERSLMVLKRP